MALWQAVRLCFTARNSAVDYNNRAGPFVDMDWAFRIRKDVPPWVMTLVLIIAILLIVGLQYFNII